MRPCDVPSVGLWMTPLVCVCVFVCVCVCDRIHTIAECVTNTCAEAYGQRSNGSSNGDDDDEDGDDGNGDDY